MKSTLLCLFLTLALTAWAVPRIEFPAEGVAFGEISAGAAAHCDVTISNAGDSPLGVSRVKACCGASAQLVPMTIPAGGCATLTVSLKPQLPGKFKKSVTIMCDDPHHPVVDIPIMGTAIEQGSSDVASSMTLPAIILAGFVDGFNPCSFAIMISLAGILAIGGRRRKLRIVGGLAFCVSSFLTYMLMGLGLMQALRALKGLQLIHDLVLGVLALALFVLSFLSFRDAARFRKVPVFTVVTLKLPEPVKILIRQIALRAWRGPAVVLAGLGCGFLVTLLDALCTGQVYVPVLALISQEPEAWRSLMMLTVYNLAFIAPLVAVFILASKTTDAFQMAKWSSRNVVPAKIALGIVFALLGFLTMPRFEALFSRDVESDSVVLPAVQEEVKHPVRIVPSSRSRRTERAKWKDIAPIAVIGTICGNDETSADRYDLRDQALKTISRRRDLGGADVAALMDYVFKTGGVLRVEREAALKNDVLNLLRNQESCPEDLAEMLIETLGDDSREPIMVDYAIQHLGAMLNGMDDLAVRAKAQLALERAAASFRLPFAGTALYSLADDRRYPDESLKWLALRLLNPDANVLARLAAIQLSGQKGYREALPDIRQILRGGRRDAATDIAAIGTIGLVGGEEDLPLIRSMIERGGSRMRLAVERAEERIQSRASKEAQE